MTRNQPRDPVTGRYVSHRNTLYVARLPVVLGLIYWLILVGSMGYLMGTFAMVISFVMYVSIRSVIVVARKNEADLRRRRQSASDLRERANEVAERNRQRRRADADMTPEKAAIELRSYNEVDQFGYCMTCGALEKLHVDQYGRPMSPKDFHVSIDDDRWDEVQTRVQEVERYQRVHPAEPVVDSPSPATQRALNPAQQPQLRSAVAQYEHDMTEGVKAVREQAQRRELNPPF